MTRAAGVCHCCGGENGGRLILYIAHKKGAGSLQCSEEHFFTHLCQWLSCHCSSEGGHRAAPRWLSRGPGRVAGIGVVWQPALPGSMMWPLHRWG